MIIKSFFILSLTLIAASDWTTMCMDTAELGTPSQWTCAAFKYTAAFVRGFLSSGKVDPNVAYNIKTATSNIFIVGVYMFPCYPCGNPEQQAQDLVAAIKGLTYNMIWIDIETYQWSSNVQNNQAFITTLANTLKNLGQTVGIYTSRNEWSSIVGLSWSGVSWAYLWYYHYDNLQNFNDFQSFGGWKTPAMKQYHGPTVNTCGFLVNLDYCPGYGETL